MTVTNKALARRWFEEVWNRGAQDVVDELLAPHAITHGIGETGPDFSAPAEF